MNWIKRLIYGRDLESALKETKNIKVQGIFFKIRKIQVLDVLDGSKVLLSSYQTYEAAKASEKTVIEGLEKKIKNHYRDVFMSSVISPSLTRKENKPDEIFVDNLFTDFNLAEELYDKIMLFTYGKKKIKLANTLQKSWLKNRSRT